ELLYGAEPLGCAGHPPLPFRSESSMSRSQPSPGLMARGGKDDDIRRNVHPSGRGMGHRSFGVEKYYITLYLTFLILIASIWITNSITTLFSGGENGSHQS